MITQIMPYLSLLREARAIWVELDGSDRERVDALVRKAVAIAPLPAPMEVVRTYLRDSNEPLPVRMMGAILHPVTRQVMAQAGAAIETVDQEVDLDNLMRD